MAKLSTVTLQATVSGDGAAGTFVPPGTPITNPAAPDGGPHLVEINMGANTMTTPPNIKGVIIVPGSVAQVLLKGVSGDTGVPLSPGVPTFLSIPASLESFVLYASAADTIQMQWT